MYKEEGTWGNISLPLKKKSKVNLRCALLTLITPLLLPLNVLCLEPQQPSCDYEVTKHASRGNIKTKELLNQPVMLTARVLVMRNNHLYGLSHCQLVFLCFKVKHESYI